MQRRQFLAASLAASAVALAREGKPRAATTATREFYQIRRYHLQSGPQTAAHRKLLLRSADPSAHRMGMGPIGAFRLDYGAETPIYYALIPGSYIEALVELDLRLAKDDEFIKAAEPFWSAPATAPSFRASRCIPSRRPLRAGPGL